MLNALDWWTMEAAGGERSYLLDTRVLFGGPGRKALLQGALRLLGLSDGHPGTTPQAGLAVIRAHAELLEPMAAQLATASPAPWPKDLPKQLAERLKADAYEVKLGASTVRPAASLVAEALDRELQRYIRARRQAVIPSTPAERPRSPAQLAQALERAKALSEGFERATALAELAIAHARVANTRNALEVLEQITDGLWGPKEHARALAAIADYALSRGEWTVAADFLPRAENAAAAVDNDAWRLDARAEIGRLYVLAGRYTEAQRVLESLGHTPVAVFHRSLTNSQMALAMVREGLFAAARSALTSAKSGFGKVRNPAWKARILANIHRCEKVLPPEAR